MTRRDVDPLWRPSDKLNAAHRELQEAQDWLQGCKLTDAPMTPVLTAESPVHRKRNTPVDGPMPMKLGGSSPCKTTGGPLPDKTNERKRTASPEDNNDGRVGSEESAQDRGDCEDNGLSQGEEEVDETQDEATNEAPTWWKTQVAMQDQKEHVLTAGKWEGLGAMRKANKVHVNVSGTAIGSLNRNDRQFPGPAHIPLRYMRPMCQGR